MDKNERKNYNKIYYLKNRNKILEKAKIKSTEKTADSFNVVHLFDPKLKKKVDLPEPQLRPKLILFGTLSRFNMNQLFLACLIALMSSFLISETASFFSTQDQNQSASLLKALILEGTLIALTMARSKTLFQKLSRKLLVFLIFIFSLWVVSGSVVSSGLEKERKFKEFTQMSLELSHGMKQKEKMRDFYLDLGRITKARGVEREIDPIRAELSHLREKLAQIPKPVEIWNTLLILVVFRFLVMISNLSCLQILKSRF